MYSLPYIIFALTLGALSLLQYSTDNPSHRRWINIVCVAMFMLFFGCRGFIFSDWQNYYPSFEDCSLERVTWLPSGTWSYEPGFTLLMLVCKSIVNDWFFFSFVCCCINTCLLLRFFRQRITYLPLGLMVYLCMGGIFLHTDLMRNSIAILIFLNSLEYLEERRPLPYFGLCLLALCFHLSSLFYLPLYFFLHRPCNKWVYLAIFLLGNAVLLLHIPLSDMILERLVGEYSDLMVGEKVDAYAEMDNLGESRLSIGFLERFFSGCMIFLYMDRLKEKRKENVVFINSFLIYVIVAFLFSDFQVLYQRISNLFSYAYWILWYDLIKCFFYKGNRWLFIAFVGLYCILKINGNAGEHNSKYENILFGASSYQERAYYMNRNNSK